MAQDSNTNLSSEECRLALSKVIASETFAPSERMRNFLVYIVDETLAGRGEAILGKTIAMDVYGRDTSTGGQSENVVRVDARRLRRYLEKYYQNEGANDAARIWVDRGGYIPRIEEQITAIPENKPLSREFQHRRWVALGVCAIVLLAVITMSWNTLFPKTSDTHQSLERLAIREKSAAAVEAVSLSEQARSFLFPLLEPERQKIATALFRQAIVLDPDYFGGYAGAGQTLTTLSLLTPPGAKRDEIASEAKGMIEIALKKDPTHPWSQSAAGWVAYGQKDFEHAFELSSRSAELAPRDGFILDFHALISILTGNFEEGRKAADPSRPRDKSNRRLANRNLFGVANIHLGEYKTALESFHNAIEQGDPISALSLLYQASAYQSLGDTNQAVLLLDEMATSWPNFRPDIGLYNFYRSKDLADQILNPLRDAGWTSSK